MTAVSNQKKYYLFIVFAISFLLSFNFTSSVRAETEIAATEITDVDSDASKPNDTAQDEPQNTEGEKELTQEEPTSSAEAKDPTENQKEAASDADMPSVEEQRAENENGTAIPQETPEIENGDVANDTASQDRTLTKEGDLLEKGETLEVESLAKEPIALGQPMAGAERIIKVSTFDELKNAIANAGEEKTTIVITKSITLTEALIIGKNQDITVTAENKREQQTWNPVKKPADYADQGEAKQREIIEEGRRRGEEALAKSDLSKNPLPSEEKGDIIIKRAKEFIQDALFKVLGKLTLGTKNSALYIDGNRQEVQTEFENRGSVIDVDGELIMKNAVIMNSYNKHGYSGPIRVNAGGTFLMEDGRISNNVSFEQIAQDYTRPHAAGAVYVNPGATFTMKNGLIDNNLGGLTGGVFAGSLSGSDGAPAVVNIQGGIIAQNLSATRFQMGGGLNGFPKSKITITDGIIAGNKSFGVGGGIGISSQYIGSPVNILGKEKASVNTNYKEYIKKSKAEAFIDGGLIYKNRAISSGGGIYVDSNDVKFGKTMILDNISGFLGGGVYVSFPPITQKLENVLITENRAVGAVSSSIIGGSNGGGLWNCPTGFVHIGDGHSVYVYNNDANSYGKDVTFTQKTWYFQLNGVNIEDEFYSHISPVTKGKNIIKFLEDGPGREDGIEIPERLSYHAMYTHLKAIYSQALIQEAWRNSLTFILGNQATNGGGFGSNGNVTTPDDKGNYAIEVNKKWDERIDKANIPDSIKADLFIVPLDKDADYVKANYGRDNHLFKYGEITLRKSEKWHGKFDTNYFNGANKQSLFDALKIKDFTDIGLPKDSYKMDRGLPFTAEELAQLGYKYLVVEQGDDYFVELHEEKPENGTEVEAGVLEITREYEETYDNAFVREDKNLYFYHYDPVKKVLTRIGQTTIHEEKDENGIGTGMGKATFAHPLLLKRISQVEKYGSDRKLIERLSWKGFTGYNNKDHGYAFVFTENEDGTLTVAVPELWTDSFYGKGFNALQSDLKVKYTEAPKSHNFTLTNYDFANFDVEKSWSNIQEKDRPNSIDLYLLLDGKRVIESIDEDGNPVYRKLTLTAAKGWKGRFEKLNPQFLAAGRYSLEENSDAFVPAWVNKKENFKIRIGYANEFREEGMLENQVTSTWRHFRSEIYKNEDGTYRDIKMNLYLDGVLVGEGAFTFQVRQSPVGGTYAELQDYVEFDGLQLETFGQSIPVKYYDVITNEPGLDVYNFYLQRDESGAYALYLPRLVIGGVPYADLFVAQQPEKTPVYDIHEMIQSIDPLQAEEAWQLKVENYYAPTHEIEILKKWVEGNNQVPDEITLLLTDANGETREITITKDGHWKKVLENRKGILRNRGYSIQEVQIPGFTGEMKTEKTGLRLIYKGKDGKEISIPYVTEELKQALENGNYRYEVFELANKCAFNEENLASFIQLEHQKDGRYIIRYAANVQVVETLSVQVKNTAKPPQPPETPPTEPPENPGESPKTGDTSFSGLVSLLFISSLGLIALKMKEHLYKAS